MEADGSFPTETVALQIYFHTIHGPSSVVYRHWTTESQVAANTFTCLLCEEPCLMALYSLLINSALPKPCIKVKTNLPAPNSTSLFSTLLSAREDFKPLEFYAAACWNPAPSPPLRCFLGWHQKSQYQVVAHIKSVVWSVCTFQTSWMKILPNFNPQKLCLHLHWPQGFTSPVFPPWSQTLI